MSLALSASPPPMPRGGALRRLSDLFYTRRGLLMAALLGPPLLWFGVIYLGSLFALLANSFFALDEFSGVVDRTRFTLQNFREMTDPANVDVVLRTVAMAVSVTLACGLIAFPIAYYMARYARGPQKALLYIAVMLPLLAWLAFWLFAVNWVKLRAVLLSGGWIGLALFGLVAILAWGLIAPPADGHHYFFGLTLSNFVMKTVYVTGLISIMLLCGSVQLSGACGSWACFPEPKEEDDHDGHGHDEHGEVAHAPSVVMPTHH